MNLGLELGKTHPADCDFADAVCAALTQF